MPDKESVVDTGFVASKFADWLRNSVLRCGEVVDSSDSDNLRKHIFSIWCAYPNVRFGKKDDGIFGLPKMMVDFTFSELLTVDLSKYTFDKDTQSTLTNKHCEGIKLIFFTIRNFKFT